MKAEVLGVEIGECADVFQPDILVQHFHEFTPGRSSVTRPSSAELNRQGMLPA